MNVLPEHLHHGDLLVSATNSNGKVFETRVVREVRDRGHEYIVLIFTDGDSGSFPRSTPVEVIRPDTLDGDENGALA